MRLGIGYKVRVCVPHVDHDSCYPVAAVAIAAAVAVVGCVVGEEPVKEHLSTLDCLREVG